MKKIRDTDRDIPGNVSQGSVFWVPPIDITKGESNLSFSIQLWDLENGNGCSSPDFQFAQVNAPAEDETTTDVPFGPFVTTALSIIDTGYVTVTATVATYQSDEPQFWQAITGSITGTDAAITSGTYTSFQTASTAFPTSTATSTSTSGNDGDNKKSGPNVMAIVIGTVGGVLIIALIVLGVLLWRVRRKRASEKAKVKSLFDPKGISPSSSPESQTSEVDTRQVPAAEVLGESARHEMMGDSSAPQELPSQNMDPVELPADEIPPPSYPGHWEDEVSPTTGASRRSSLSFDKGTFTVSPLSDRRDRKE